MAEKRPKSILSGLKNMLHLDSEKSKPAPKSSSPTRKKPPAAEKRAPPAQTAKEQRPAAAAEASAASDPAAGPKTEKDKVKNQPWYRHRQRW